jgi:hypothetical protein
LAGETTEMKKSGPKMLNGGMLNGAIWEFGMGI